MLIKVHQIPQSATRSPLSTVASTMYVRTTGFTADEWISIGLIPYQKPIGSYKIPQLCMEKWGLGWLHIFKLYIVVYCPSPACWRAADWIHVPCISFDPRLDRSVHNYTCICMHGCIYICSWLYTAATDHSTLYRYISKRERIQFCLKSNLSTCCSDDSFCGW